jgi:3-isopropylmalate/(R)-2-methylmalate dehydratase small subunit
MTSSFECRARRLGDNVNTDYIISSARKRETIDESVLKQYLMEAVDPAFAASVRPGDVIVAGRNFGCGSAMEVAATVILAAGIRAVLAESFARAFFRNAINNGLMPVEIDTDGIHEGDRLEVKAPAAPRTPKEDGKIVVTVLRTGVSLVTPAWPPIVRDILASGGLVPYLRREGRFRL